MTYKRSFLACCKRCICLVLFHFMKRKYFVRYFFEQSCFYFSLVQGIKFNESPCALQSKVNVKTQLRSVTFSPKVSEISIAHDSVHDRLGIFGVDFRFYGNVFKSQMVLQHFLNGAECFIKTYFVENFGKFAGFFFVVLVVFGECNFYKLCKITHLS